jgi:hypothetical protein
MAEVEATSRRFEFRQKQTLDLGGIGLSEVPVWLAPMLDCGANAPLNPVSHLCRSHPCDSFPAAELTITAARDRRSLISRPRFAFQRVVRSRERLLPAGSFRHPAESSSATSDRQDADHYTLEACRSLIIRNLEGCATLGSAFSALRANSQKFSAVARGQRHQHLSFAGIVGSR